MRIDFVVEVHGADSADLDFAAWVGEIGAETFWSWGADFDFPHMEAASATAGIPMPWRYSSCHCARTVWHLAFPDSKATEKNHYAVKDARIATMDLLKALKSLQDRKNFLPTEGAYTP